MSNESISVAPEQDASPPSEGLLAVINRRGRYVLAIVLSGLTLAYLTGRVVAPPPPSSGASLLLWNGLSGGLLGALSLLGGLLLCIAVSMVLTHPDAPHAGMFCAFAGLAYLSFGSRDGGGDGSIRQILALAQPQHQVGAIYQTLALESLFWAAIVALADRFTVWLHALRFANAAWLTRHGVSTDELLDASELAHLVVADHPHRPVTAGLKASLKDIGGALLIAVCVNLLVLTVLLRSELKGQTIFAGLAAGYLAGLAALWAFPRAPLLAVCLAVPLALAGGYFWVASAMGVGGSYPGIAALALGRALPLDLVATGVAGAIVGAHTGIRMVVHRILETE